MKTHNIEIDDIVDKYYNKVYKTIQMKRIDITDDFYAKNNEDFNKKDLKFKVGYHVRISKYKNIFTKGIYSKFVRRNFCH